MLPLIVTALALGFGALLAGFTAATVLEYRARR